MFTGLHSTNPPKSQLYTGRTMASMKGTNYVGDWMSLRTYMAYKCGMGYCVETYWHHDCSKSVLAGIFCHLPPTPSVSYPDIRKE